MKTILKQKKCGTCPLMCHISALYLVIYSENT